MDKFFHRDERSSSRFRHGIGKVALFMALAVSFASVSPAAVRVLDASTTLDSQIQMTAADPAGVVAYGNFIFVLQKRNNRIAVYRRASPYSLVTTFGTSGTGRGQFSRPEGMALDPTGARIAVADTGNHRVQTFTINASSGALSFEAAFGSRTASALIGTPSAPDGTFAGPRAVSFCPDGSILVADAGNFRVQHFSGSGGSWSFAASYYVNGSSSEPDTLAVLNDVCSDTLNGAAGFWVSDGHKDKYTVSFYPFSETASLVVGLSEKDALSYPVGLAPWASGSVDALLVADRNRSRIAVVDKTTGRITDVIGDKSVDGELEIYEQVYQPWGLFADVGRGVLYVADNGGSHRVNWYGLSLSYAEDVMFTVTVSAGEGGAAAASGTSFFEGESVTLTATPDEGFVFDSWTIEGATPADPTANPLVIDSVSADITATANFVAEEQDEEYEESPWPFTSISVADGTATLAWALPAEDLPSDGSDLLFRIGYRASLTEGDWDWTVVPANDVAVAQGAASGSVEIDVSAAPFSESNSAFFKLVWTNKVK